jgi:hypothetical protein
MPDIPVRDHLSIGIISNAGGYVMKKITTIAFISVFVFSLFAAGSTATSAAGPTENVIVVYKTPVTQEDVKYLESLGGVIKYTYTIIDGVAASLPQAAVDRLRSLQGNPADPVASRIKYIENDGTMYALEGSAVPAGQNNMAVQATPATGTVTPAVAGKTVADPTVEAAGAVLQAAITHLVNGDMHVFPVLPLTAAVSGT